MSYSRENHYNLLAGDQIDSAAPRRWLLVSREMPVPSEEDGASRWALDHLFLDQDGIPTLVEVKRSSDTRGKADTDLLRVSLSRLTNEAALKQFLETCDWLIQEIKAS